MGPSRITRTALGLLVAFASAALLSACGPSGQTGDPSQIGQVVPVETGGSYTDITPAELAAMFETKDFFFVNVHIPYEGEIAQTDAFIPFDQIEPSLSQFPQDRSDEVVLYCRSGSMSAIAARSLVEAGYTQVYNLDGGFRAWQAQGYPLIK